MLTWPELAFSFLFLKLCEIHFWYGIRETDMFGIVWQIFWKTCLCFSLNLAYYFWWYVSRKTVNIRSPVFKPQEFSELVHGLATSKILWDPCLKDTFLLNQNLQDEVQKLMIFNSLWRQFWSFIRSEMSQLLLANLRPWTALLGSFLFILMFAIFH